MVDRHPDERDRRITTGRDRQIMEATS